MHHTVLLLDQIKVKINENQKKEKKKKKKFRGERVGEGSWSVPKGRAQSPSNRTI